MVRPKDIYVGVCACVCVCVHLVAQSCLTLCDPVDCGPPGSFVHGIFHARIVEWVAIPFSRGCMYTHTHISSEIFKIPGLLEFLIFSSPVGVGELGNNLLDGY